MCIRDRARRYEDYPCAEEYSYLNGKLEREEYKEGIYTGYRLSLIHI